MACVPSRHEGFPVARLEGMACGLPILATAIPGITEIMGEQESLPGVVVPIADVTALERLLGLTREWAFARKSEPKIFLQNLSARGWEFPAGAWADRIKL